MSNYSSVTPRNLKVSYFDELKKIYKNQSIDDSLLYSPNKNIIIGVAGLNREIPFVQALLKKESFSNLFASLNENSRVLISVLDNTIYINNKQETLSNELKKELLETISSFDNYGGYLNDNGEHVIDYEA